MFPRVHTRSRRREQVSSKIPIHYPGEKFSNFKERNMAEETVTLRDVFELPKNGKPDPQPTRWEAVQERIKQEVTDVKFPAALHELGPKICELFNVPLPNILVTSW